jgi:hypothetical protein
MTPDTLRKITADAHKAHATDMRRTRESLIENSFQKALIDAPLICEKAALARQDRAVIFEHLSSASTFSQVEDVAQETIQRLLQHYKKEGFHAKLVQECRRALMNPEGDSDWQTQHVYQVEISWAPHGRAF